MKEMWSALGVGRECGGSGRGEEREKRGRGSPPPAGLAHPLPRASPCAPRLPPFLPQNMSVIAHVDHGECE